MKKRRKKKKLRIHKLVKEKVRKEFIEQGGNDGRFREKIIPDKTKEYSRSKVKKNKHDELSAF